VVKGMPTPKPSSMVSADTPIRLAGDEKRWVSRGALKLLAALDAFPVEVAGKRVLDVGASTGGFTQVLLEAGAEHVVSLDVGRGQLHEFLRAHQNVTSMERTNFRNVSASELGTFSLVVADVSFISLCTLAEKFSEVGEAAADYLLLVKPQFEARRGDVGRGGIVTDPEVRWQSVEKVVACLDVAGIGAQNVIMSPIKGSDGNVEYLLWLRKGDKIVDVEVPN